MPFWSRSPSPKKLLERQLLVRVGEIPGLAAGNAVVLEEDLETDLVTVRLEDGKTAVPTFTSERELLAWDPSGGPWVALNGRALFTLVCDGGFDAVVIDPAADSRTLDRDAVAALLGRA